MHAASGPFKWWMEERGDLNENWYGINHSKAPNPPSDHQTQSGSHSKSEASNSAETWSLYDHYHAVETMDVESELDGVDI